jgi:creatinine amidohydrolase
VQWEHLTATEFRKAAEETGICILAMGVVEQHSEHLPLGTDYLNGHRTACLAAEKEPAVVFPPFYFGQNYESRCFPGAVTLEPTLLLTLLRGLFDEIGRNGFRKIVLHKAHGGNWAFIPFLAQCELWEEKPYHIYVPWSNLTPGRRKAWNDICETKEHGHACECETSISLANHPDLVKMDKVLPEPRTAQKRLAHLPPSFSGIHWYSDYPDHYAGDARSATAEKGKALQALEVDTLAEFIAAVKADEVQPALTREFFDRCGR